MPLTIVIKNRRAIVMHVIRLIFEPPVLVSRMQWQYSFPRTDLYTFEAPSTLLRPGNEDMFVKWQVDFLEDFEGATGDAFPAGRAFALIKLDITGFPASRRRRTFHCFFLSLSTWLLCLFKCLTSCRYILIDRHSLNSFIVLNNSVIGILS